jgi:hypothetical protein
MAALLFNGRLLCNSRARLRESARAFEGWRFAPAGPRHCHHERTTDQRRLTIAWNR